jgi:hypothetical protein
VDAWVIFPRALFNPGLPPREYSALLGVLPILPTVPACPLQLDVLAGTHAGGCIKGSREIEGQPFQLWHSAGNELSYVKQQNVLPIWDTAREALMTSALLQLPRTMTRQQKLARVEELLELLRLLLRMDPTFV